MPERLLHLAPLACVHGPGDEIGDRAREVLLLHRPVSRRAGVLVANHARDLSDMTDGSVNHGDSAEVPEVRVEEARGARIVLRVMRGDASLRLQRTEVRGVSRRRHLQAGGMVIGGSLEEIGAAEDATIRRKEPDPDPLDADGASRRLCDLSKRRLPPGQLDEHLIVPPQAILGLAQNLFGRHREIVTGVIPSVARERCGVWRAERASHRWKTSITCGSLQVINVVPLVDYIPPGTVYRRALHPRFQRHPGRQVE